MAALGWLVRTADEVLDVRDPRAALLVLLLWPVLADAEGSATVMLAVLPGLAVTWLAGHGPGVPPRAPSRASPVAMPVMALSSNDLREDTAAAAGATAGKAFTSAEIVIISSSRKLLAGQPVRGRGRAQRHPRAAVPRREGSPCPDERVAAGGHQRSGRLAVSPALDVILTVFVAAFAVQARDASTGAQ